MTHESTRRLRTLHGLKLKGFAEVPAVAAVSGLPEDHVGEELSAIGEEGLALRRDGRISGWVLTPAGKAHHKELLMADVEQSGHRDHVHANYTEFLVLNGLLLRVCTDWQVIDLEANELNDHLDPEYDEAVVLRLAEIHTQVTPICEALAGRLTRYAPYHGRFEVALTKVQSGLPEWFAKPIIDSYHTVWMELHEDLLATLAIERSSEGH